MAITTSAGVVPRSAATAAIAAATVRIAMRARRASG